MRRLPVFIAALFFGVAAIGCDSADDDPTDAEIFLGTWAMVNISDDTGDKTAGFAELTNSVTASFTEQNSFLILVDYKDAVPRPDQPVPGTYVLDAGAKSLILTLPDERKLNFNYVINTENEIRLTAQADFINALFNPVTPYEGTVNITVQRVQ